MDTVVIAIDGPAGAGKSTLANALAVHYGFRMVPSGLFYRALTCVCIEAGVNPSETASMRRLVEDADLRADSYDGGLEMFADGRSLANLKSEAVNRSVAAVAADAVVRRKVTGLLRAMGGRESSVIEGRDIGTVVFPDTPYQIYLDASLSAREQRRALQSVETDCVAERDRQDRSRAIAPLEASKQAVLIDSGRHDAEEVFGLAVKALADRGLEKDFPKSR